MQLTVVHGNIADQSVDCIIVNLFDGVTAPGGATGAVDKALGGAITNVITSGDFTGKTGSTTLLYTHGKISAARVLLVGLGASDKFDLHGARKAAATAAKTLSKLKGVRSAATIVHGTGIGGLDVRSAAQALAEGSLLALYQVPNYKREKPETGLESLTVVEFDRDKLAGGRTWGGGRCSDCQRREFCT